MRKVLRIQNYLNRKLHPIPIEFSEPYKLTNSSKVIIPFKDKLFFQTPIMRLENLLELSNGVYCAEFALNNTLKHTMLRRFLMNLDLIIIQKLYTQSTELFKSSNGRAIQFSKEVIKDKYYPGMRYEDTNDSFYVQLIINESMFSKLEEQSEYYLYVQIENIQFHKKLFLSNLKLESFQEVSMETDSELESDEEEEEEEEEEQETTDDTRVVQDQKDMESLQVEVGSSTEAEKVEQATEQAESKVETQEEIQVETENQETPDEELEKLIKTHNSIEDQQDESFIQSDTNNPEAQDSKQLSGVSGPTQNELMEGEIPNPDELSKLIEMKMTFQKRLEELDTMTRDMQQIYHKLNKNKQ